MKKILILIVVLAAGGFSLYWFASHRGGHAGHRHEKNVYYCPMHPQIQRDKPGDCPICYMKLVKKENGKPIPASREPEQSREEGAAIGTPGYVPVELNEHQRAVIGLKTAPVERRMMTKTIRAVGTVAHDTELYQTQAEYLQAAAALKKTEDSGIPEIIEQAKSVVDAVRLRLIHRGFHDGLIEELKQKGGPDYSLLLVETGPVWVYAQIYQQELPFIDVGTPVKVDVSLFSQENFEGVVRAIDPMVDMMTRTVRIRIQIKDAKAVLKPDMYVNATMDIDLGEILAVPHEAVMDTGLTKIVYVQMHENHFEPRRVETGFEGEGVIAVTSGLKEGERVVVDGNFLLDSESRLKAAIAGASGEAVDPHAGHK